jgi:hypothetical protein
MLLEKEAKPCPFCGNQPYIEPWYGGRKSKRMISCQSKACFVHPGVTGTNRLAALKRWNIRSEE